MSAPSVRRLRDRNGVAAGPGKNPNTGQKPTRTLTPVSTTDKNPSSALKRSASGKENPFRSSSKIQRPSIRPVPRLDKSAVTAGSDGTEGRMRWSTSSAPRGRSPSPSEFIRVLRDSRVSKGEGENNRLVSSVGKKIGPRFNRDNKENDLKLAGSDKKVGGYKVSNGIVNKDDNLSSNLIKSSEFDEGSNLNLGSKEIDGVQIIDKSSGEKSGSDFTVDSFQNSSEKSGSKVKVLEKLKEKGLIAEGAGNTVTVKYPSKLHEKLAFLEGKVKRIASDIKKTKEMLDMNNPDASKVILSDIQEKISGIEKAMGNVTANPSKADVNDGGENDKAVEKSESKKVCDAKGSVKGLSSEELEARLFPHQKLLRNRPSLKASTGSSQSQKEATLTQCVSEPKAEDKLLSPIDENPIAVEFLASLNKEASKVTVQDVKLGFESSKVQETEGSAASGKQDSSSSFSLNCEEEIDLTTDENFDEFDDQENRNEIVIPEGIEDPYVYQVNEIGTKNATGGWFVSEGESVVLAHDDGSCSFYDITNCEEKTVYKPPVGLSPNMWRDCWIIRAPSADGCSGKYVVAASAGNTLDAGFCSWDFYSKDVRAFHIEDGKTTTSRTVLGPLPNNTSHRRNALPSILLPEMQQWWYKPCGPLMVSTASSERVVQIFDIRDGEQVMKWEVQKPVLAMDYSSPLQWRNRGKVVVAEVESISVWDVNSLNPQPLSSISTSGRKISAFHVVNTDAELGGGVRQRVSSAEAEGNDGVFCTADSINVLDFRNPSGIGLKIPKIGVSIQSAFTRGDSIYIGCANTRNAGKKQPSSEVQQFSLRKQRLVSTYSLPESNAHSHCSAITQVWGNSNFVMGVCGLGMFVFDALRDDALPSFPVDVGCTQKVKEVIGPDDLYSPSFDYLASRVLLVSRDRPALWRHVL